MAFGLVLLVLASSSSLPVETPVDTPVAAEAATSSVKTEGVQWKPLLLQSLGFLAIEHGFRYATEPATRAPGRPVFGGYADSLRSLHGWGDGDPFFVNYVGHPLQGAISGFIWIQNDGRYRNVEFGRNREYWKSRLRAGAFAWVYSTQLEIGPISEATIGSVQAGLPQQGFVDQVITPSIGLGWVIGEDAIDQYVIRRLDERVSNRYYRALYRSMLNPSRSMANMVAGHKPWFRPERIAPAVLKSEPRREILRGVAPFELGINSFVIGGDSGPCVGGGATAAFRIRPEWQIVGDVNGCDRTGLGTNLSGDFMTYLAGLRWTPEVEGRWHPYIQLLAGGNKVTEELLLPDKKAALELEAAREGKPRPHQSEYTQQFEASGYTMSAGTGVDFRFNEALSLRVLEVDYTQTWEHNAHSFRSPQGFQFRSGLVLRMGTW